MHQQFVGGGDWIASPAKRSNRWLSLEILCRLILARFAQFAGCSHSFDGHSINYVAADIVLIFEIRYILCSTPLGPMHSGIYVYCTHTIHYVDYI